MSETLGESAPGGPAWKHLDQVDVPTATASSGPPAPDPNDFAVADHPFSAREQWGIWVGAAAILPVVILAAAGWWQWAIVALAAVLVGASIFRLRNKNSWLRARSRRFDVTVSWTVAAALIALAFIPTTFA